MPCWKRLASALLLCGLLLCAAGARAGSIEPRQAALTATEDGYALSADFVIDLGGRIEEVVSRGVPLHFVLEFDLTRPRWYWASEHIVGRKVEYKLAYNALTRQYRLSVGTLHQNFAELSEALRVLGRVAALPVAEKTELKPGETFNAALRLALDRSQLPKPFQVDAIANKDWQIEARILRWQFVVPGDGK